MAETKRKPNNQVHLYGFINDVRINPTESGKTAINLDVVTLEQYKDRQSGEYQSRRTYHDVPMFTEDQKVVDQYKAVQADCKENAANREVEGYKPKNHTVSLDGIAIQKGEQDIAILAKPENVRLDVKQEENEVRNRADIVGNIGSIDLFEDKGFATMSVAHHYRPEGAKEDSATWLKVRVDAERKYSKPAYEAILNGDLKKGDFVRLGGQLHNNRYTNAQGEKKYSSALDLTSFEKIERKQAEAKTEKVEVKEDKAPAKKAETKAEKKPSSRKKAGIKMS